MNECLLFTSSSGSHWGGRGPWSSRDSWASSTSSFYQYECLSVCLSVLVFIIDCLSFCLFLHLSKYLVLSVCLPFPPVINVSLYIALYFIDPYLFSTGSQRENRSRGEHGTERGKGQINLLESCFSGTTSGILKI